MQKRKPSFLLSLIIIVVLAVIISFAMLLLKLPTIITLFFCIFYTGIISVFLGHTKEDINDFILGGVRKSAFVIVMLLVIGCLIGSWIVSGIIPTIIYYGLDIINPNYFLVVGLISCSIISYFTGSAYACIGTIGVSMIGIAEGMGISLPITAGMILSGALFGDKMSPFSDTTNMASGVTKTPLFVHIKSMLYTTFPAWIMALIIYAFIGRDFNTAAVNIQQIDSLKNAIQANFQISPLLLIVPLLTVILAIKKIPPVIAIGIGAVTSIIVALIFQHQFDVQTILRSLVEGVQMDFGSDLTTKLFSNRGGMENMMHTISIVIIALIFGEIITKTGILGSLIIGLEKVIYNTVSLVFITILSCLLTTMISNSQYLSILMPGEAFLPLYKRRNISSRVLSRSLEDGGTMFGMLVPWTGDAAFVALTLGVATIDYLPFTFFALLSPVVSVVFAAFNIAIWKSSDDTWESNE
jgi:NhaC family Na+:H+ antiporter